MDQTPLLKGVAGTRGVVTFRVGDTAYAAPVDEVAGLIDAERLSPLPGRTLPMAGVVAFRGSVVPVLDLASALGSEPAPNGGAYAVVLERGTDRFALLVRGMPRLVPASDVRVKDEPPPPEDEHEQPVVRALYEIGGRDVLGLDFWSLMDSFAPPAAFRLSGVGGR